MEGDRPRFTERLYDALTNTVSVWHGTYDRHADGRRLWTTLYGGTNGSSKDLLLHLLLPWIHYMDIFRAFRRLISRLALVVIMGAVLGVSGCTKTKELNQRIKALEAETFDLRIENSRLKSGRPLLDVFSMVFGGVLVAALGLVASYAYLVRQEAIAKKARLAANMARLKQLEAMQVDSVEKSVPSTDKTYLRVVRSRAQAQQESLQ